MIKAISLSMLGYVVIGYLISRKRVGSFRAALGLMYPKKVYWHSASLFYLLVFLINFAIRTATATLISFDVAKWTSHSVLSISYVVTKASFFHPTGILLNLLNLLWTLIVVLCFDFAHSLIHYASHKIPALWQLHKIHHEIEVLSQVSDLQHHTVDLAFSILGTAILIGLSQGLFITLFGPSSINAVTIFGTNIFFLLNYSYDQFRHSPIWLDFGSGIWGNILLSPCAHLIHHSTEKRHLDKNFGRITSVCDRMLGTLYIPKEEEHFKIGVRKASGEKYVTKSLWYIYFGIWLDVIRAIRGLPPKYDLGVRAAPEMDRMWCWCGPDCKHIDYPFDRPEPEVTLLKGQKMAA